MSLAAGLLRPVVLTGLLAVVQKGLQAAVGILLAYRFGASLETDAYLLARSLPAGLYLVADSMLYNALVPRLRDRAAPRDMLRPLGICLFAGLVLAAVIGLLAPILVPMLAPGGSDPEMLELGRMILKLTALALPFALAASLLKAYNASRGRAVLAAVDGVFISGASALVLWFVPDARALLWLTLAFPVACAALFILQAIAALRRRTPAPEESVDWSGITNPMLLLGGLTLAQQTGQWFMNALASFSAPGGIATLNFSYAIGAVPVSVIDLILFSTFFPFAAGLVKSSGPPAVGRAARNALWWSLAFTFPGALLLILLREPVVAFVLERGMFTDTDADRTAITLAAHAVAIPFWVAEAIACRALFALSCYGVYLRITLVRIAANMILGGILVSVWGVFGVALAFALSFALGAVMTWRTVATRTR